MVELRLGQRSYIFVMGGIRRCTSAPRAASSFDDAVTESPDKNLATTLDGECLSQTQSSYLSSLMTHDTQASRVSPAQLVLAYEMAKPRE